MIRQFLQGLPYTLTKPMLSEYKAKCGDLNRWIEKSASLRVAPYLRNREAIQYIFALGIYYRHVVAPLSGSARLIERLEASDVKGLKVGGRTISSDFRNTIDSGIQHFNSIISEFGITETFFAQSDVVRIVMSLIELEERRARE